jgi:hypothetical protein
MSVYTRIPRATGLAAIVDPYKNSCNVHYNASLMSFFNNAGYQVISFFALENELLKHYLIDLNETNAKISSYVLFK